MLALLLCYLLLCIVITILLTIIYYYYFTYYYLLLLLFYLLSSTHGDLMSADSSVTYTADVRFSSYGLLFLQKDNSCTFCPKPISLGTYFLGSGNTCIREKLSFLPPKNLGNIHISTREIYLLK